MKTAFYLYYPLQAWALYFRRALTWTFLLLRMSYRGHMNVDADIWLFVNMFGFVSCVIIYMVIDHIDLM